MFYNLLSEAIKSANVHYGFQGDIIDVNLRTWSMDVEFSNVSDAVKALHKLPTTWMADIMGTDVSMSGDCTVRFTHAI